MVRKGIFLFREVGAHLKANRTITLVSILTIAFTLWVFALYLLFIINLRGLGISLQKDIRVTVYLRDDISPEARSAVESAARAEAPVRDVVYISKQQALQQFRETVPGEEALLAGLISEDGKNPLPESFELVVVPGTDETALRRVAERLGQLEGVEEVQYGQDWIRNLTALLKILHLGGIGLGAVLSVVVVTVIANTIRLSVYTRREEIEILKLIGASERFIRAPFIVEGALVGATAAGAAVTLLAILFSIFRGQAANVSAVIWSSLPMAFLPLETILSLVLVGSVLGGIGSLLSLRTFRGT